MSAATRTPLTAAQRAEASRRAWETIRANRAAGIPPKRPRHERGAGKRVRAVCPPKHRPAALAAVAPSPAPVPLPAEPSPAMAAELAALEAKHAAFVEAHCAPRTAESDEAEWLALEAERANLWTWPGKAVGSLRPSYPDRPHRQSYGADLPLRSELKKWTVYGPVKKWTLTPAERASLASRGLTV